MMEVRVTGVLVRACWAAVLVCGTWALLVTGVDSLSTRYDVNRYQHDSLRLLRLKLKALELGSEVRQKRTPHTQNVEKDDTLWALLSRSQLADSGTLAHRQINYVKRSSSAMESFRVDYETFYNKLSSFIPQLAAGLVSGAPSELQNVKVIPTLLPLNDRDLLDGNTQNVLEKARLTVGFSKFVLAKIGQYVADQSWFTTEKSELEFWISFVEWNFATLNNTDDVPTSSPAGIGGIILVPTPLFSTAQLNQLRALQNALNS